MGRKKVYTVATSHLDTVWSWDFETTTSKYIYNTLVENFALLKKYPSYVFSFEGSYRYELMEEYYPELFEKLKQYVADGRWNVTGSAFENGDVNCPSPEALFRNILIGNSYFDETFGKRSVDIYLPDCFGFGWALPSIAHHAHLLGFTTQKLAWGSAYGVPFDLGKWKGVDGESIYASCNPHDYYFTLTKLRDWDFITKKLKENEQYGLDWTYLFHGIGDRGGAPEEATIRFVDEAIKKNDSEDIEVVATSADQIFRDMETQLPQEVKDQLPVWDTELVMQNHGVGGYTSRAIGKRWNAKCQELGDMAERAGVMASYYGTADYNEEVLEKSWKRAIAHQFHDDTPGTSCQRVYRRSWNDYAMSINQFTGEIENYLGAVASLMRTDFCAGTPVVVYNALEAPRRDVVTVQLSGITTPCVKVVADNLKEVPAQVINDTDGVKTVLFVAEVPSLGMRVYDVRESNTPSKAKSSLTIDDTSMENEKYRVTLNRQGNITSIIDKTDGERELLAAPIVLGLFDYTGSEEWPAWEMNYAEANKEPDRLPTLVSVKIAENGPARVAFEILQKDGKSTFKNYLCLTEGGDCVTVYSEIEWQSLRTLAKNRFAFTANNEKATFDLGLGAIQRGNMSKKLFEVPAQKWADITDEGGDFGVSVISSCKHGWDKYNNNTLRLTVLHTPKKNYRIDSMQSMMDLGLNRYEYAIYSHRGAVGTDTQLAARRFTSPLTAVTTKKHRGPLGSSTSFAAVSTNDVIIRCIKKKHHSDQAEYVVRFNEGANKTVKNFTFTIGDGIDTAYEAWGSEEYRGEAKVEDGKLVCDFKPYEVKTFVFTLKESAVTGSKPQHQPLALAYNNPIDFIPERLRRSEIEVCGIPFRLGDGCVELDYRQIKAQKGGRLALLCANFEDDEFVNNAFEAYARWDLYDFGETAYIKDGRLGYEFTHSIDKDGKTAFAKGIYFWVKILEKDEAIPADLDIVILAATELDERDFALVTPLMDEIENNRPFTFKKSFKEWLWYISSKCVWNLNDKDDFLRHNNNGKNGKRVEQSGNHFVTRTVETTGH
ncbi:MAG: hypothetical protein IJ168_06240 [Eubacterium sp.]|nr:hypothetical protein [Eubacterium sp.]